MSQSVWLPDKPDIVLFKPPSGGFFVHLMNNLTVVCDKVGSLSKRSYSRRGNIGHIVFIGLSGGNRTPDPQLRRLLLYPTELRTGSLALYDIGNILYRRGIQATLADFVLPNCFACVNVPLILSDA
ncbi:MAG: hypothetical protein MESAZ_02780 [Saezia sanguinis]